MISRSSQSIGLLSQLRLPHLSIRRNELLLSQSEGTTVLFSTLLARINSGHRAQNGRFSPISCRTYTDRPVSRPKAHTGRKTTTRKKNSATATQATKKPSSEDSEKPAAKKAKAKPKSKPKSKASSVKRSKAKAKPKPKTKPKPKSKVKKVLTEKQEESLAKKKEKEDIKALKTRALTPPKIAVANPWVTFSAEQTKGSTGPVGIIERKIKEAAQAFRDLPPERHEHYNHVANQNKVANQAEYRKWVHSYTPQEIHSANLARLALKRRRIRGYPRILDDRQPLGPRSSFALFIKDRWASGDLKGISVKDSSKLIGSEWKALSNDDKKKYNDLAAQDVQRHAQETKSLHSGDAAPEPVPEPAPAASAASAA